MESDIEDMTNNEFEAKNDGNCDYCGIPLNAEFDHYELIVNKSAECGIVGEIMVACLDCAEKIEVVS